MRPYLAHIDKQLSFQYIFTLLIFLLRFVCLIIFPANDTAAATTRNVAHNMPTRRHVPFNRRILVNIDDSAEKKRLAVLAAEILSESAGTG